MKVVRFALFILVLSCTSTNESSPTHTNPTNRITLLGKIAIPVPIGAEVADVYGYAANGKEYALVGGYSGSKHLFIFDVTDHKKPKLLAQMDHISGFDIKVWKNYAYTVSYTDFNGEIIDLTHPENPKKVGSFYGNHNITITEDGYMYNAYPEFRLYDLNKDPKNPELVYETTTSSHDMTVINDKLYDFKGFKGTYIYDISTKSTPELIASINNPDIIYNHSGWTSFDQNYLFITDELSVSPAADLYVYDIKTVKSPKLVLTYNDPKATIHNVYQKGNFLYASYYTSGFKVFDITNPEKMTIFAEYDTNDLAGEAETTGRYEGAFGIYPYAPSGVIYISDDSGLYLFSVNTED